MKYISASIIRPKKAILLLLGLLLVLSVSFFLVIAKNKNRPKQPTLAHLQAFYQNWLTQEEQNLWTSIESKYGIRKQECIQLASELKEVQEPHIPLSPSMHVLAHSVIKDFNVNQAQPLGAIPQSCLARANKTYLYINERKLKNYPLHAKKFIIAHESRHIANQDACMGPAFNYLCECKGIKKDHDPSNIINKMTRFFELRADMETAIKSVEYAQGLMKAMDLFKQEGLCGPGLSHPTLEVRKSVGEKILRAHNKVHSA